jgi:Na+/H+ antiporter NhaC
MASAGAQSDHVNHVSTQLPYALTAAAVSAVGFLIAGIIGYLTESEAALISLPITLVLMLITLFVLRRIMSGREEKTENNTI